MIADSKWLNLGREHEGKPFPVKRGIASVNCAMVVRADQHQILQAVLASSDQPTDMVCFTKFGPVPFSRLPAAQLCDIDRTGNLSG